MNTDKNKGGRPPVEPGQRVLKTSITLTHAQQIALRRLGGSLWVREQIKKATASNDTHPRPTH